MKKNMALVMATMMAAASLTACGGSGTASTTAADTKAADTTAADSAADTKAAPADKIGLAGSGKELIFTTGGDQGTYYGFGSVIAGQISDLTDTTVTAIVGKGSKGEENFSLMIEAAKKYGAAVRIGVNWGSLDQELLARMMDENQAKGMPLSNQELVRAALVESAISSADLAVRLGLGADRIVLSAKVSVVQELIAVYRMLARRCQYALHLGLTEAGIGSKGIVASTAALAVLLQEGIGDTIRVSLTGDPVEEVKSARLILKTLGLRKGGVEVVSCPTCGRTQIDLIHLANQVEDMVSGMDLDVKVAVMGCVVNGPGEARSADIGIAGGIGEGLLIKKGEIIKKVPEHELLSVLREELLKMQEMQK